MHDAHRRLWKRPIVCSATLRAVSEQRVQPLQILAVRLLIGCVNFAQPIGEFRDAQHPDFRGGKEVMVLSSAVWIATDRVKKLTSAIKRNETRKDGIGGSGWRNRTVFLAQ